MATTQLCIPMLDWALGICAVTAMALGTPGTAWSMFSMEELRRTKETGYISMTNPFLDTSP